jgi:hypothetical protein
MTSISMIRAPLLSLLALVLLLGWAHPASAQIIKQPGNHPNYAFELEPHLLAQYSRTPFADDGVGVGLRAAIPFMHNGPVPTINNNIGITFGMDYVHFGDDGRCVGRGYVYFYADSCSAFELWFPVTGQWNFFLTPVISVFGEFGLAARYARWEYGGICDTGVPCDAHASYLDLFEPVLWGGGRFLFAKNAGLTVRLGWPYIAVGASILF